MITIVKNELQAGVKRYVCDKSDDLPKIDLRTTRMGSTCFVIEENASYILTGQGKWSLIKNAGGNGGNNDDPSSGDNEPSDDIPSDTPIDEDNTYIWDGGEVV